MYRNTHNSLLFLLVSFFNSLSSHRMHQIKQALYRNKTTTTTKKTHSWCEQWPEKSQTHTHTGCWIRMVCETCFCCIRGFSERFSGVKKTPKHTTKLEILNAFCIRSCIQSVLHVVLLCCWYIRYDVCVRFVCYCCSGRCLIIIYLCWSCARISMLLASCKR